MATPPTILTLVDRFHDDYNYYRQSAYNETQVRQEFIDPLFEALGWDIGNKRGAAAAFREVVLEYSMKIGDTNKAPDYLFRLGNVHKFFVEAKKPSVNLKAGSRPAYQVRRYAWTAGLPLSVLTDFEEFVIYDCRVEPKQTDKATDARHTYVHYTEYADKWDVIAELFHRDAVLSGSLERFIQEHKAPKGALPVDKAFLAEINRWRDLLAKNIYAWDKSLVTPDLNYAVQMTLDRILFLRICEDRGIERYGRLQELLKGGEVYKRLVRIFKDADDRYNSGLFHFQVERGREESPDTLTPHLHIDDEPLKAIIKGLYYPDSPYEFSMLPVEVLGNVYEQFLGKVIRVGDKGKIEVEEKPEVRKAGGVYYTPSYIVEYIVRNTVGKLVEGKTPKEAAKLRILDPACGSGSFLIGAYQYLLDWHRDWYIKDGPQKHKKELYQGAGDNWYLTTGERKRILLENIYGLDIDAQAVEVTKLSLCLKMLEGETDQTLNVQLRMFQDRALPDLSNNIKFGNSLIGSDIYDHEIGSQLSDEDKSRINAFNWSIEFPKIIKAGGFNAVIGNPPYGAYLYEAEKSYLNDKYKYQSYQLDSYLLFLENSVQNLLSEGGYFGMIIPNPWLTNLLQKNIRRLVTEKTRISEIVHFRFPVFPKVTVDTEILILQKLKPVDTQVLVTIVPSLRAFLYPSLEESSLFIRHEQQKWQALQGGVINIFTNQAQENLANKCRQLGVPLSSLSDINVGVKPYQTGKGKPPQTSEVVEQRPFDSDRQLESSYRPYLRGSDITRYRIAPLAPRYIKYGPWLAEPRPAANFDAPVKIVMRQTGDSLVAALDTEQYICLNNMHVIVPTTTDMSPYYLLGVINSKLLNWYYHTLNPEVGEALAEVKKTNVAQLPIRRINFDDISDKDSYDQIVRSVMQMLSLRVQIETMKTEDDKRKIQRQIVFIDKKIDRIVYDLYKLNDAERELVES